MTTLQDPEKGAFNMTLLECEPNTITLIRTADKDGYAAIQLMIQKTKKRQSRHEFRLDKKVAGVKEKELPGQFTVGEKLGVTLFAVGERVRVSGTTKAKGFQGVVKRHGFAGAPSTHGRKHDHRKPGSIGSGFPEHVTKGKRMAGRMGGERSTSLNLKVVYVDEAKNLLGVRGAVPGIPGGVVEIVAR